MQEVIRFARRARASFDRSFTGRCVERMNDIDGSNLAVTLAGQAFVAVIPALIIAASLATASGGETIGSWLITNYRLSGSAAKAVEQLFAAPPSTTGGITFLGVLILMVSLAGLVRTLQATFEKAWSLPARGFRGAMDGLGGTFVLTLVLAIFAWLAHLFGDLAGSRLFALPIQLAVAVPLWLLITSLMLSRRVPYRRLLPGAVITAAGQVALTWWTSVYVPRLIANDAGKYGAIGVAFALVSWLVLVAYLIVASAAVGSVAGEYSRWQVGAQSHLVVGREGGDSPDDQDVEPDDEQRPHRVVGDP